MVPNAIFHNLYLANVMVMSSSLWDRIRAAWSDASGALWKTLVACAWASNGVFTISDGLMCWWKGKLSMVVIPEDLSLH